MTFERIGNSVGSAHRSSSMRSDDRRPVLIFLEGIYDIECLCSVGDVLHASDDDIPSLVEMEEERQIVFVPFGGAGLASCIESLQSLGLPMFILLDSEVSPETERRQRVLDAANERPDTVALLTAKRSSECYLHARAIRDVCEVDIAFGDHDDVVELVATQRYRKANGQVPWTRIPPARRRRLRNRAKRMLNLRAVKLMTPALIAERDPDGEVIGWLRTIGDMAANQLRILSPDVG